MNKICVLIICSVFFSICVSACNMQPDSSMIKAKRKFAKYIEPNGESRVKDGGVIDLSEGPKLRYDANFGPSAPNFDIKIVNPYW